MAITQEEFKALLKKRYLFHLHTTYTDGNINVQDYFEFAIDHNIKTLIFTEHVRKNLDYSFNLFVDEIHEKSKQYPSVNAIIGAEAKILPDKQLDISDDIYDKIDLLAVACHGFPENVDLYFDVLHHVLSQRREKVTVFVHPGRYLKKRKINNQYLSLQIIIDEAVVQGIYIENNKRENLPDRSVNIPEENEITGFDIHGEKELNLVRKYFK